MRNLAWMLLLLAIGWLGALALRPQVGAELVKLVASQARAQTAPYGTGGNSFTTPYIPGSPMQPTDPQRPASWPGSAPEPDPRAQPYNTQRGAVAPAGYTPALSPGGPPLPNQPRGVAVVNTTPPAAYPSTQPGNPNAPPPAYPSTQPTGAPAVDPRERYASPVNPQAAPTGPPQPIYPAAPAQQPPDRKFIGADVMARIGLTEVVLGNELLPEIEETINNNLDKLTPDQIEPARQMLLRQRLPQLVETKLMVAEARRNIPPDNLPKLEARVRESFDKEQLPKLLETQNVKTRAELDAVLKQKGTSLENKRRTYFERSVAMQWVHQSLKDDVEVSHEEMLRYYRDHQKDYETPAQAKWEHLMVKPEKYSSRAEAYRAIAQYGNQIFSGAPFEQVAREHSDDGSSFDGGVHDWTSQGSLVSTALDQALFGLPIGRLSQIIEDEQGFHIVRVTERKEFTRKPFTDMQPDIKKEIRETRRGEQQKEFLAKLKAKTPVWTVFDGENATAEKQNGATR